ncbi:MAG: hypothetical protein AAFN91_11375 [Pseudomonadota bacterium]
MSASSIIRRCASLSEARICVGLLKARGFLAEIDNAAHAELDWGSVPALGGVAIRVPRSQFEPAKREIIDAIDHADEALINEYGADHDDRVDMARLDHASDLLRNFQSRLRLHFGTDPAAPAA